MFCKGLKEAGGDETKVKAFCGSLLVSFLAEVGPQRQRQLVATYTREGEGHANEGYAVSKVCTDFDDILFETDVKFVCSSAEITHVHELVLREGPQIFL